MLTLDFSDKSVTYATFVSDVAAEVVRQLKKQQNEPEIISQNKAYAMFGRGNVDRWKRQGKVNPFIRPGKIEYGVSGYTRGIKTMNGYLPVGRFYRLYRIVARKNEKQRVTIINLTH